MTGYLDASIDGSIKGGKYLDVRISGGSGVVASIEIKPDDVGLEINGRIRQNDFSLRLKFLLEAGPFGEWKWESAPWVIVNGFDWYGPKSGYVYHW